MSRYYDEDRYDDENGAASAGSSTVINGIYYIVTIICVGISTYASYGGLRVSLGELAIAGAALIGLVLFASDLGFSRARQYRGASFAAPAVAFLFVLFFSTASNFNHFYTYYQEDSVASESYQEAVRRYQALTVEAREILESDPAIAGALEGRAALEDRLVNLRDQLLDPQRPGFGARSREIVREIYAQLPTMTELAEPSPGERDIAVLTQWYQGFAPRVLDNFDRSADVSAELREANAIKSEMQLRLEGWRGDIPAFQANTAGGSDAAVTAIETMNGELSAFRDRVNAVLSSDVWTFESPAPDPRSAEIGDIVETFQSALSSSQNIGVTIWSVVLSLFIDLIPIVFAFTLVQEVRNSRVSPRTLRERYE